MTGALLFLARGTAILGSLFLICGPAPVRAQSGAADPETIFRHPPETAKPGVLWMWMGTNINREQITQDLEALKKQGFNRTTMFSLSDVVIPWSMVIKKSPTPDLISWTEPWWKMVRFAAEESKRLGMDFGMFNGSGYETSGGPWVTPALSMQELCWTEARVNTKGPTTVGLTKPMINPRSNMPFPVYDTTTGQVENPVIRDRQTYYRDIAVLALPATGVVDIKQVVDLTAALQPDGTLRWNAPGGDWVIYRIGHTTMGALIQPAQPQAIGLECDKMSQAAVENHIDHIIDGIKTHLGDLIGSGFTHVHFDSYEAGIPTWTPKMKEEFANRRGYDLTPFLPTVLGRVIGSALETEAFKKDLDETIKDLYRDCYFATLARKLKAANLGFLSEPYGGPWRQEDVLPLVQNVMVEFWTNGGAYTPYELDPTVAALRVSGQNIIESEAFTGQPADSKWTEYPGWLKPIGDAAFCAGVNRIVIHRFTHQPWDEKYKPGNSMGQWGTHFDRTQTWWQPAHAMIEYWQRCEALLQWGRFVNKTPEDFSAINVTDSLAIGFSHRRGQGAEIYFIANTVHRAGTADCRFAVSGLQPERWDPVTGEMSDVAVFDTTGGTTTLQLDFDDAQSFFIVFRKKAPGGQGPLVDKTVERELYSFRKPWRITFDPTWGGPKNAVVFPKLQDWTLNADKGIRYYSGTALYETSFPRPHRSRSPGSKWLLKLGIVNHIASVSVNGHELGVVWTAPWQIAIPDSLLRQTNELSIAVTNEWANRLIGDEQEPADMIWEPNQYFYYSGKYLAEFPDWFLNNQPRPSNGRYCFTTWNYFEKDSPLIPSGLLGPVRLVAVEKEK